MIFSLDDPQPGYRMDFLEKGWAPLKAPVHPPAKDPLLDADWLKPAVGIKFGRETALIPRQIAFFLGGQ